MTKTTSHVPSGNDKPCPNCGHCPTCGRANAQPYFVPYPWYPTTYPWHGQYWISTGVANAAAPNAGSTYTYVLNS